MGPSGFPAGRGDVGAPTKPKPEMGRTDTSWRGGAGGLVRGTGVRHRLNRGGNRRLNAVLYRIALTQAHFSPAERAYLDRRVSEGKTRREAMRALKRFLVRAIWRLWIGS